MKKKSLDLPLATPTFVGKKVKNNGFLEAIEVVKSCS